MVLQYMRDYKRQASFIRERRLEKGLSCQQVAIYAGTSRSTIIRLEQFGIKRTDLLHKIAKVLDVNPLTLLEMESTQTLPFN